MPLKTAIQQLNGSLLEWTSAFADAVGASSKYFGIDQPQSLVRCNVIACDNPIH